MLLAASLLTLASLASPPQRGAKDLPGDLPRDLPSGAPRAALGVELQRELRLDDLRTARFGPQDVELRVWSQGGFAGRTKGAILSRRKGRWSGRVLTSTPRRPGIGGPRFALKSVPAPTGGWGALWQDLERLRLREIPDELSLPGATDRRPVNDGISTLFELREGAEFRAFAYESPARLPDHPSSRRVTTILARFGSAFPRGSI